jgi:hypothetical protein
MADEKTVVVKEGTVLYTGMGLHPFVGGDHVTLAADVADELVGHGVVEHHNPESADEAKPKEEAGLAPAETE